MVILAVSSPWGVTFLLLQGGALSLTLLCWEGSSTSCLSRQLCVVEKSPTKSPETLGGFGAGLLLSTSFCDLEKLFNLSELRFPHLYSVGDVVLVSQTVEII